VSLPGHGAGPGARETDRGTWWLVAQRDFWYRLRDKGFVISSGITLAVLTGLILLKAYAGGGTPTFDLGLLGTGSARLGPLVVQAGDAQGTEVRTRQIADRDAADVALADGSVDGVLVDGKSLLAQREVPGELQSAVQTAVVADGIRTTLEDSDVPADEIAQILNPKPVPVETLEPQDPNRETNSTVAFIAVVLLYGQLFGYGVWVATGVIEEKASRVVEILLSTIRARQLLAGKILGIGTLGLLQLIAIATYSIVLASLTGALDFPAHALGTAALAIGWFMLGFAFYASLFAVAGALVSRMEELQNVIVPLNLVILVSFFLAIGATSDPSSTLSRIVSIVPFSSALAMPVRISLGAATPLEIVAALVLSIGSTALLIPLAGRVYSGAVLRTGARVKLREAWRSASN
jgi:ABC-2 type transport system permease protein